MEEVVNTHFKYSLQFFLEFEQSNFGLYFKLDLNFGFLNNLFSLNKITIGLLNAVNFHLDYAIHSY